MEINPLSSFIPGLDKRPKSPKSADVQHPIQNEVYRGPNLEAKKSKLIQMDGVRPELVTRVKEELQSQQFFTEEKMKRTIDALLSSL